MSEYSYNLTELLDHIDPAELDYADWVAVGMALKQEGYTAADWDEWSRRDPGRYHGGECFRKWDTFQGSAAPVTGGTIVQMARERGWQPEHGRSEGYALDWDSVIDGDEGVVVKDSGWVEQQEITEPGDDWKPEQDLIRYLETLFHEHEYVNYVTESWQAEDGSWKPTKGSWDRTAGQLIKGLKKCKGDIGAVLGDYNPEGGAWIRFNPVDGPAVTQAVNKKSQKGVKNDNITDFRYALVESDTMELGQQNALIRELELPVACLVYSGGKSLHAIVRIDAADKDEYRKRVDYLYAVLKKNCFVVDVQDKNPSRLSRLPGAVRNGRKQFLVDTNIGKKSWGEWKEWIESATDDLPDPVNLSDYLGKRPPLSPELIRGVLRQGHKLLLAGGSKSSKSFALIELAISIAEGRDWLGFACAKGKVLYINLEIEDNSGINRFLDIYEALGWEPLNIGNIDIWNLRGRAIPMDKLAPRIIRRAAKKNYIAVIIDPIYKVITGDENSADQMAAFCNQFDRVCTELKTAVIYCHHHSKGFQGQKRSMDRASGSGVFARDPDALLDMIELEVPRQLTEAAADAAEAEAWTRILRQNRMLWPDSLSENDHRSAAILRQGAANLLPPAAYTAAVPVAQNARDKTLRRKALRIEGTLREFPSFAPVDVWFDYPVHHVDTEGILTDTEAESEEAPWEKAVERRKASAKKKREDKRQAFENAVNNANFGAPPTVKDLAEYLSATERTVRDWVKKNGYKIDKNTGTVSREESDGNH